MYFLKGAWAFTLCPKLYRLREHELSWHTIKLLLLGVFNHEVDELFTLKESFPHVVALSRRNH